MRKLTKQEIAFLNNYSDYFRTAVYSQYSRAVSGDEFDALKQLYEDITGTKQN